jgi:hypothetical protein
VNQKKKARVHAIGKNPCYTSPPFNGTDSFLARQLASLVKEQKRNFKILQVD